MSDVSIKEVAELAGVSIATVSRCMNTPGKVTERTRQKVLDAIAQTGYAPNTLAQSFRRGSTKRIMIVLPSIGDPFFTAIMRGVRKAARASGYSVVIDETEFNTMTADEVGRMLVSRQTDGIILIGSVSPFGLDILSVQDRRRLPIVVGCEKVSPDLADLASVSIDNAAAARDATNYLISQGHKRIGMIHGQESSLLTKDRELGYREAMQEAALEIEDGWAVEGQMSIAGAREATRDLLGHPSPPTAIFCANDEMAIGCLHEIKAAGLRVPDDVSVMGFDDIRYAEVTDPPLTTIGQPAEQIGELVMYRICRRIEEGRADGNNEPEIVPHKLIVRQSVAAPKDR